LKKIKEVMEKMERRLWLVFGGEEEALIAMGCQIISLNPEKCVCGLR